MLTWLQTIDNSTLWIAFYILLALGTWVGVFKADPRLKNKKFKRPMLAFELAGSVEESAKVLDLSEEGDVEARKKFHTALLWDFLFICCYPFSTAIGCLLAARFFDARGVLDFKYGVIFVLIPLLAGVLDVFENVALLRILRGPVESPWPQVARWCAIPKFTIVCASLLFAVAGGLFWLISRLK